MLVGRAAVRDDLPTWTVLVAQPASEALAAVRRMATLLGTALALTLLGALVAALAAARRVTRPLAELTTAAHDVGRGAPRRRSRCAPATRSARSPPRSIAWRPTSAAPSIGSSRPRSSRSSASSRRGRPRGAHTARRAPQLDAAPRAHAPLPDDETRELLHLVRDEVDRIEGVVSGLLELGRPRELRIEVGAARADPVAGGGFRRDAGQGEGRRRRSAPRRRRIRGSPAIPARLSSRAQPARERRPDPPVRGPGRADAAAAARTATPASRCATTAPAFPPDLRATLFQPFATRREAASASASRSCSARCSSCRAASRSRMRPSTGRCSASSSRSRRARHEADPDRRRRPAHAPRPADPRAQDGSQRRDGGGRGPRTRVLSPRAQRPRRDRPEDAGEGRARAPDRAARRSTPRCRSSCSRRTAPSRRRSRR